MSATFHGPPRWPLRLLFSIALAQAAIHADHASADELQFEPVGAFTIRDAGAGSPGELSAIVHDTGDRWLVVSDANRTVYPLRAQIDLATGAVLAADLEPGIAMEVGVDLEGLAWDPVTRTVIVSDEAGPHVRIHDFATGALVSEYAVPPMFMRARPNYSLESWSRRLGGATSWTANEEALDGDGPLSTFEAGTVVRLQRYNAVGEPDGQWAYRTERINGDSPFITEERSGVSDLLALPDGRLLVLERELGASGILRLPRFRSRIYEVDFTGATDVRDLEFLEGTDWTPVTKSLRWQASFDLDNFEGIALGPRLDDGSMSVLLVSDNGGGPAESLVFALRLYGVGLTLQATDLIRNSVADFTCTGAWPRDSVVFLYSLNGVGEGPGVPLLGGLTLDVRTPVYEIGRAPADDRGTAVLSIPIPADAPRVPVFLQAVVRRGPGGADSLKSNPWITTIR